MIGYVTLGTNNLKRAAEFYDAIGKELGVGEGLISFLDDKGRPEPVERAFVLPPASRIGPITTEERKAVYDKIRDALVQAQSHGPGAPVVIEVPIPAAIIQGPLGDDGGPEREVALLQRTLTYRLGVKRVT